MTEDVSTYARRSGVLMRQVRKARGLSLPGIEEASCGRFRAGMVGSWERGDRGPRSRGSRTYADWLGWTSPCCCRRRKASWRGGS